MAIYIEKFGYSKDLVFEFVCKECGCEWLADEEETSFVIGGCNFDSFRKASGNRGMPCPCCRSRTAVSKTGMVKRKLPISPHVPCNIIDADDIEYEL